MAQHFPAVCGADHTRRCRTIGRMNDHPSPARRRLFTVALSACASAPALTAMSGADAQAAASVAAAADQQKARAASEVLFNDLRRSAGSTLIGFSQVGPGAVVTSVNAQLSKTIHSSDYATIQQAHDAVVAAGGGTLWVVGHNVINQPFRWDYNKVFISGHQGRGSTLDFSKMTAAAGEDTFAFILSNPAATKGRKTIQHVTIIGPAAKAGVSCFSLDSNVGNAITNINFIGVTFIDFKTQLYFGSHCSNIYFNMCQFTNSDGANFRTTTVIHTPLKGITNSGENWSFAQCQFNNVDKIIENNSGISGGWSFTQCALVYFNALFDLQAPCKVTVDSGSHIESDSYSKHWISTNGNGCLVRISHSEFWFAGKISKEIFRSNTNTVFGGIFISDCDYHADKIQIQCWVDQTVLGPVVVHNWRCQDGIARIPFGKNPGVQQEAWLASHPNFAATLLAQPGDTSKTSTVGHAQRNAVTCIETTQAGQEIRRTKRYPIRPGQNIEGCVWIRSAGFSADTSTFGIYLTIYDAHGLEICSGHPYTNKGDSEKYTCVSLNWYPLAPAGAAFYEFRLFANASVRNTRRSIFISDLVLNTY